MKNNNFDGNNASCGNDFAEFPKYLKNIQIQEFNIYDLNNINANDNFEKVSTFIYSINGSEINLRNY